MRRLRYLLTKELLAVGSSLPFHLIVLVMPIMFLTFWVLALGQDITLPVGFDNQVSDEAFTQHLRSFSNPNGVPYFRVQDDGPDRMSVIHVTAPIRQSETAIEGDLELEIRSIDRNMTKNYRNRLTGAVTSYVESRFLNGQAIDVDEQLVHPSDVPWTHFFVTSIAVMGMLMGAMLYGALSITSEWNSGAVVFVHTSPRNPFWILLSKQLAILAKGVVGTGLMMLVAALLVPDLTLPVVPIAITALVGYWTIGLGGVAVGTLVRDPITCFLIALLGSIAFWLLGNGFGDMTLLGSATAQIALFNPATHLLSIVQHFALGTPIAWWRVVAVLGAWTAVLQALVIILYRARIHLPGDHLV
jgi:ABC-2 type transport system permease protein